MREKCCAAVFHRDQLRVCREGKRKFRMHYDKRRCTRWAGPEGLCRQHASPGVYVVLWCDLPEAQEARRDA